MPAQRRFSLPYREGDTAVDRLGVQKSLEVWLIVAGAATMNGMFRGLFLVPRIGEYAAHVLSVLLLMIVVLLASSVLANRILREYTNSDLFLCGFLWVLMSVSADVIFEHFVLALPWKVILHDYDLSEGRIWTAVLTTELIGPWFMASDRR